MIRTIIFLLFFINTSSKPILNYSDISNDKQSISLENKTIFILNYNSIFCRFCIVKLEKKLKSEYIESLFFIYLKMNNDIISRVKKETYIKTYLNPDAFIYDINNISFDKSKFLIVLFKDSVVQWSEKEIFDRNGIPIDINYKK